MNKLISKLIKFYNSLSLPVRASVWFTFCNFLLKGISFIAVPIFTRVMPASEYGKVSIYNSFQQILLIFATFEIYLGAYQRGILKYKEEIEGFTLSTQITCNILTIIMFLCSFIFKDWFINQTEISNLIYNTMFLYFFIMPAYQCWIIRKRFDYEYKPVVITTMLFSLISTFGVLGFVLIIGQNAIVKIYYTLIIQILFCMPFYINNYRYFHKLYKSKMFLDFMRFEIKFEAPLVLHSLSYLILAQADSIMIGMFVGKTEAAYYSVAYNLANLVIIFQNSINQVLTPYRFKKLENKDYNDIKTSTNYMLLLISGIVIIFLLFAPEIMILFDSSYYQAIWCIPPISISVYFMFLYSVFVNIESYYGKTHYVMVVSIICALLNVVLNYYAIDYFGYIACGYTTLISYILFALLHYFFMCKTVRNEGVTEEIIEKRIVFLLSLITLVVGLSITFLYNYVVIRYLILFVIIVLMYLKRNVFLNKFIL